MKLPDRIVKFSLENPKFVLFITLFFTLFPAVFFPMIKVDTDPENMLSHDEAVRIFHDKMKKEFSLYDMVIVGIVNEKDPDGVFNPQSLDHIHQLTEYSKDLKWMLPDERHVKTKSKKMVQKGVIESDIMSPGTVDNIEQAGPGTVNFSWLMKNPPKTREEARKIRDNALKIPFLNGTLVSEDGKALCIYLPITDKNLSYKISEELKKKIAGFKGSDKFFITGLPVAEDTFGVEMFIQMAISAPMAMLLIFILLLIFFKKLVLIFSPMILAVLSVVATMGLLIGTGNTVHIMSSMIPIFIMPIAVLDSIHILSEFFDRYQKTRDRKKTIESVMNHLFMPMLYTSLTSAAGFASLALTPIPPVQVFGIFIGFGVMLAWVLTITFIPAYITLFISEKSLEDFGTSKKSSSGTDSHVKNNGLEKILSDTGYFTFKNAKIIIALSIIVLAAALYGVGLIKINDNPTRWFEEKHPIRVADHVLNSHFGGTYMAYLTIGNIDNDQSVGSTERSRVDSLITLNAEQLTDDQLQKNAILSHNSVKFFKAEIVRMLNTGSSIEKFYSELYSLAEKNLDMLDDDLLLDFWQEILDSIDSIIIQRQQFKSPENLNYVEKLQRFLEKDPVIGKTNSLVDIVKTIHRELFEGRTEKFVIPDSSRAVAQCLMTYQSSHRPQDLWHFVNTSYDKTNLWIQLKSGDNKDMSHIVKLVDNYFKTHPLPGNMTHKWFGLTYINVIWQEKMVAGMLQAFLGSFLVVFIMMTILFKSAAWGFLSMIPLSITIAAIYGFIGYVGKDYDMPVAVLSSLTLGLAVDFAIHFLARSKSIYEKTGSWEKSVKEVFGEPANAISRNIIIIAVGFLPLLAAPLVPYQTVGIFLASILGVAGIATLTILPALLRIFEKILFPKDKICCFICNGTASFITIISFLVLVVLNLHQFTGMGIKTLSLYALGAFPVLGAVSFSLLRSSKCSHSENKSSVDNDE